MKASIFYFSATGSCLKVARDLAKELGDAEIINIVQVNESQVVLSADRIGIIYPVYMYGKNTLGRKRYRNPEVNLQDVAVY